MIIKKLQLIFFLLLLVPLSNVFARSCELGDFDLCQKKAGKGSIDAQYQLGQMYRTGEGVPQDYQLAKQWYQKAASKQHPKARYWLRKMKKPGFEKVSQAQNTQPHTKQLSAPFSLPATKKTTTTQSVVEPKPAAQRLAAFRNAIRRANKQPAGKKLPEAGAIAAQATQLPALTTKKENTDPQESLDTLGLTILNYSAIETSRLNAWATAVEEKIAHITNKVLVVVYPVGKLLSLAPLENTTTFLGAEFQVTLKPPQINQITANIGSFLKNTACMAAKERTSFINDVNQWLQIGGGSQLQVPLCKTTRVVLISIDPDRMSHLAKVRRVFFHETYHGFQANIRDACMENNEDSVWLIESGAEYFARYLISEQTNQSATFASDLLKNVAWHAKKLGSELADPGIAEKGMGVLRLMVEQDELAESSIIDASLYQNCQVTVLFDDSNPKMPFFKKHWHQIIERGGVWQFNI